MCVVAFSPRTKPTLMKLDHPTIEKVGKTRPAGQSRDWLPRSFQSKISQQQRLD
jgi:hypothetical protein